MRLVETSRVLLGGRVLGLADGSVREFPRVTGATSFAPADLRGAKAVLLSDDSLLFARFEDGVP